MIRRLLPIVLGLGFDLSGTVLPEPFCDFGFSALAGSPHPPAELIANTYARLWRELGSMDIPSHEIPESPFEVPHSSARDVTALRKSLRHYEEMLARQGWLTTEILEKLRGMRGEFLRQANSADQARIKKMDQNVIGYVEAPVSDGTFAPDGSVLFSRGPGMLSLVATNVATGKSVEKPLALMKTYGMLVPLVPTGYQTMESRHAPLGDSIRTGAHRLPRSQQAIF